MVVPPPDPGAPQRAPGKTAALMAAIAAACAIAAPGIKHWEGRSLVPYRDIGGVNTVCDGLTKVEMRTYTPAECDKMLDQVMKSEDAMPIIQCVPDFLDQDRKYQFAASIILAHNIGGAGAFCRSTAARRFNAGAWKAGCDAFLFWNKVNGRVVQGLVNRRKYERDICLKGLAA